MKKIRPEGKFWQTRLPWYLLYFPFFFYGLYLAIRARKVFYWENINPCMDNSGAWKSSKTKYLSKLPTEWVPNMEPKGFPRVLKPDNGQRGKGVKVVRNMTEEYNYMKTAKSKVLVQEFCDLPNEAGIFWVKDRIVSITGKRFVPGQPIGSHNLGTTFLDYKHKITPELNDAFFSVTNMIDGFQYGRFDIKFNTWEELERLENFKIIEINGVNSENTIIYDPCYTLKQAYRDIYNQMNIIYNLR